MEPGCNFDQELADFVFFEDQNALHAPQSDLSCDILSADCECLFYTNHLVDSDWSQLPDEFKGDTPLDIKPRISRPDVQDEFVESQEWTEHYSEEHVVRIAWPETRTTGRIHDQRPICTYHGCTSTPFRTTCDLKMHLSSHSYELLSQWIDGEKQHCKWPGCSSKATFKSKRALQTHLENIHVDPLLCPEKGCSYRIPFRSNYDLKRHVQTVHYGEKDLQFQCPFPECSEFPKTFVRKDKWLNHLRSAHDYAICPLNHCEAGTSGKLVEHIKNCHGNFECKIGSCEQQLPSRFAKFELMKHLEFHHGVQNGDINVAQNAAIQARDRTIRSEDLPRLASWVDCGFCFGKRDVMKTCRKDGFGLF